VGPVPDSLLLRKNVRGTGQKEGRQRKYKRLKLGVVRPTTI
jgi:hypothetical protein